MKIPSHTNKALIEYAFEHEVSLDIDKVSCFTYILQLSNGKYYTGITGDILRRMNEHQAGLSKSTKRHLPIKVVWITRVENRKRARRIEVKIKKRGASRFLRDLEYKNTQYPDLTNIWMD